MQEAHFKQDIFKRDISRMEVYGFDDQMQMFFYW